MLLNYFFQLINLLNFFSNIYILFLLFIFGYLEILAEGFLVVSLLTILTQGFSANIRNIYLSTNFLKLEEIIFFRALIGIIGFIITAILAYIFISESNILFHSSIIFLTTTNWILELLLAKHEKKKVLNVFHLINIFLFFLITLILFLFKNIYVLSLFFYFNSLINVCLFYKNLNQNYSTNYLIFKKFIFNLGTLSTFIKTIANFLIRYFIIIFVGKANASLLFIGATFGSFFGTLFDVSYGALFMKKIKNKILFINNIFILYCVLVFLFIIAVNYFSVLEKNEFNIFSNTSIFSMCGSYLLIYALIQRQSFFEKKKFHKICYKIDILIYVMNFLIVLILYKFGQKYLIMYFFFSSFSCFLFYKIYLNYVYKKNI